MPSRGDHDGAVARLYAAAAGQAPWSATLAHLAALFHHSASVLALVDASGAVVSAINHGYDPSFAADYYASEVFANDPRTPYHFGVRPGSIYFDRCLYDVEAMMRDPRCQASTDLLGVAHQLGAVIRLPRGGKGYLTLLSTPAEGQASEEMIRAFHRLAPFAEHACALGEVVGLGAATQWVLLEALTHKVDGVILLDHAGTPIFINEAAGIILAAQDGLHYSAGHFEASRGPESRQLNKLIGEVLRHRSPCPSRTGTHALLSRPSGRRPYVVHVLPPPPIETALSANDIACVLHLTDLASVPAPSKSVLQAAFGLTAREADLAIELVRTNGLSSAAAAAGMALNTARNHLQNIFRKSQTTNQAEAIQLLGRLV